MPSGQPTDEDLIAALRTGDLEAFEPLYARYERRLFGYIRRMVRDPDLAEDLFQDVFFTVLCDRTFDPTKGRFSAWLFTVARNRCLMAERKMKHRKQHAPEPSEPPPADPEAAIGQASSVRAAMASLSEPQRQLLILKQVGELTYREIATLLGVAEGTIKSRLHGATRAFRQRLTELGES